MNAIRLLNKNISDYSLTLVIELLIFCIIKNDKRVNTRTSGGGKQVYLNALALSSSNASDKKSFLPISKY